jgi:hypothetical protein
MHREPYLSRGRDHHDDRHRGGVGLPCPVGKRGGRQGTLCALRVQALARQPQRGHSDGGPIYAPSRLLTQLQDTQDQGKEAGGGMTGHRSKSA